MKKYPDRVYEGISSNPQSWGMCCNEDMARKCAEEWYEKSGRFDFIVATIIKVVYSVILGTSALFCGYIGYNILLSLIGSSKIIVSCSIFIFLSVLVLTVLKLLKYYKEYKNESSDFAYYKYKVYKPLMYTIGCLLINSIVHYIFVYIIKQ